MNPKSSPPPLPKKASEIYIANLLVLPGLGSFWIGKKILGLLQALLALMGVWLLLCGFLKKFLVLSQLDQLFLARSLKETDPFPYFIVGICITSVAWISAFLTAYSYSRSLQPKNGR